MNKEGFKKYIADNFIDSENLSILERLKIILTGDRYEILKLVTEDGNQQVATAYYLKVIRYKNKRYLRTKPDLD